MADLAHLLSALLRLLTEFATDLTKPLTDPAHLRQT
jgi:hypothetical protein